MIQTEIVTINDKEFRHNYSDSGYYIRKIGTNEIYEEAYDLLDMNYLYEETDDKIENIGE